MKKVWIFLLSTSCILLVLLIGLTLWAYENSRSSYFISEQVFIRRFSYTMQKKDFNALKKMVSINNDQLENWQVSNINFVCPLQGRGETVTEALHKDISSTKEIRIYDFYYSCTLPSQPYQFSIENIEIQENNGEWEVIQWGKVCESIDRSQFQNCHFN